MGGRTGRRAAPSTLCQLRDFLTLEEAAIRLSRILDDPVDKADVLQLALGRRLTLSVHLVNGADALRYRLVPQEGAQASRRQVRPPPSRQEPEPVEGKGIPMGASLAGWNTSRPVRPSLDHHSGVTWEPESKNTVIFGVWDLPMIGNERFDIERRYQQMSSGPAVIPICWEGVFVERSDFCCQLLTRTFLGSDGAAPATSKGMSIMHPANALPSDSVLGVRSSAVDEFSVQLERQQQPSMIGGPSLAAWIKEYKRRTDTSNNKIAERTGLANKTIKKICEGKLVRKKTWDTLARHADVPASDVPTN